MSQCLGCCQAVISSGVVYFALSSKNISRSRCHSSLVQSKAASIFNQHLRGHPGLSAQTGRINFKDVGSSIVSWELAVSLPSRCGSSSCPAALQSHSCHFTDSTLEHHARTIAFLLAKPQGAQLTPRSPWRLAQRNAINNTSSAVPTQPSITKGYFRADQAVEARHRSHAEFRCLVLRCGGLRTRVPDQR